MAPIGWQVFAGLMVKAERSATSAVVCRRSIVFPPVVVRSLLSDASGISLRLVHPRAARTSELRSDAQGGALCPSLARDRFRLEFFRCFPRRPGVRQNLRVHHSIDLPIEVDRTLEAGVGPAVIVVVKLLALHARLLHRVLLLDAGGPS